MHEASLAGGVLRLVEQAAAREPFRRLIALRIVAGQLSGVDVSALRFALEAIAPGTLLEGARIDIDQTPGKAWCLPCGSVVALPERGMACPLCGGYQLQPTDGTKLRVVDLQVSDE